MGFREDLTPEVADLRARVRRFIDTGIIPQEAILDKADGEARDLMAELQERAKAEGLWALNLPREIGGGELPFMPYVYVNEVIGRSDHAMVALGTHITQDSWMLHLFGTPEQRSRWLIPMVRGEITPSIGMTEPEVAGSDPTGIRSTARLEGDTWVVNAHKWFTTGASVAAFTTMMVVTEPDAPPHARMSMILVPTDTPGYEIVRIVPTMGDTTGLHCEIRLTDVRVPKENLLGERGAAFGIAQKRLGPGRIYHCMRWLGQAQRAFELMCDWAIRRRAFGSTLAEKQTVQNWIADSAAEIQAARLLTLDAARKIDEGDEARIEISLIKFFGARVLHDVIDRAIQVHGARGVSGDTPLEKMYRHARYARIYDGPDEVHRMVVSRRILKQMASGAGWDFAR